MAGTSQVDNVELMTALTGLTHDIFVGKVENVVRRESPSAMVFQEAGKGDYRLVGQHMRFAVDLRFKTGAMASDGKIPDYHGMDAVQGYINPIRRYSRIALDNFVEQAASGEGAFENLSDRIFDQLWDAWKSMEIRHSIGSATGLLCKVSSRTSSTVWVAKDAFGHSGTNPLSHFSEGSILGWYDVSTGAVGGAGAVSSINHSTAAVTMASATPWETAVGAAIAADDLVYFATTDDTTATHFTLERNLAPNGIGTIVDPDAGITTKFQIAEATYPRWKPFRKASVTFDHLELTEFWQKLGSKRGFKVSPASDVTLTFPSLQAQLARSLMGFQQQAYTGKGLRGGYDETDIQINGIAVVSDQFFYRDVAVTLCKDYLYRIPLGKQADFWGGDGSMWSRFADYDGREAYVVDYLNFFSNNCGAHGALTGIVTDVTDSDWDPVPNY